MDSMDNVRERFTVLEQQIAQVQPQTHAREVHTRMVERRRRWWCIPWRVAAVLALGLALVPSARAHAKTFHCGAGDVQCLIDAIHEANANGKKNTIRLAAGTYTLTEVDNTTDGPNGLPSITSEFRLTIQGAKDEGTIIERQFGAPHFRLIHVAATGTLTLDGLTLQGGNSDSVGGGIFNDGTLTLTHSTVSGNAAHTFGGGISNNGTLTLTNSTVSDNAGSGIIGAAGGIWNNNGTLTLINSTVSGNREDGQGGGICGGGIWNNNGTLTLINSTVSGNRALNHPGGGICGGGNTTLQNTIVALNTANLGPDCFGSVTSQGNNLVGDPTGCTITLQATDLTGDPGFDLDDLID
jgi:hypothetical protein